MMCLMLRRVLTTKVSTGVPLIGKKRIRCSGGGSGVTSRILSSSVWLVFSVRAYQSSLAVVLVDMGRGSLRFG